MLSPRSIPLGRLGGARVAVDPGTVLAVAYFGWTIVDRFSALAALAKLLPLRVRLVPSVWAAIVAIGLAVGLVLHTVSQAIVARLAGGRVQRVTISLFGGRVRVLAPGRAAEVEWRAALAGPVTTTIYALIALSLSGFFGPKQADVEAALFDLGRWQLLFAMVQLLPAFPFDGGRILRALASRRLGVIGATRLASLTGRALAISLLAVAIWNGEVPFLFLALFLWAGANADQHDDAIASALDGQRAIDAMRAPSAAACTADTCGEVELAFAAAGVSALPIVDRAGELHGALAPSDLRRVSRERRWMTTIAELLPQLPGGVVPAAAPLDAIRRSMRARRTSAVAVIDERGRLIGVLSRRRIDDRVAAGEILSAERVLYGAVA
jgi:stage IV sporulation protein FB